MIQAVVALAYASQSRATDGAAATASKKPNVILMMADDLGFGDLSCYGSESIKSPVLDKLASQGVRLTSFYAGCTVCTPSRMSLLTGAYPPRVGWRGGVVGYGIKPTNGLAPEALTIAEVFKSAGYATGLCGKWHLGDARAMLPMNQGFESAYYITKSNNQTKKVYRNAELVEDPFDNRRLTEQFVAEAKKFIDVNRAKPFFLYLPFTAPHFPANAHPDWQGRSSNDEYGDVVEELDGRIGEILETLKQARLERKTIIVFLSDNGPEPGQKKWASSKPFRGLKWSSLEGGTRVPCIIRWPGEIPAGHECDELVSAIDLLPTIAHACGIDLAAFSQARPKIDGVNVWDSLINKPNNQHGRTSLLYWSGRGVPQAIRVGTWKLYLDNLKDIAGSDKAPVLIDLAEDPTEQTNLSRQHPRKVQAMRALALEQLADIEANAIPLGGPVDQDSNVTPKRGVWIER